MFYRNLGTPRRINIEDYLITKDSTFRLLSTFFFIFHKQDTFTLKCGSTLASLKDLIRDIALLTIGQKLLMQSVKLGEKYTSMTTT